MAICTITTQNDADFYRQFAYQQIDLTPIDLTGSLLRMGVRRRAADIEEQLLLTTENGGLTISPGVLGLFTVLITMTQLQSLQTGDYDHSLIRIFGGLHLPIWSGTLTVNPGPSR